MKKTLNINKVVLTLVATLIITVNLAWAGTYNSCLLPPTPLSDDWSQLFISNGVITFTMGRGGSSTWRAGCPAGSDVTYPNMGRFAMGTSEGSALDDNDDGTALTWGYPYPAERFAYLSMRVDGTDADELGFDGFKIAPYTVASGIGGQCYLEGPKSVNVWLRVELIQDTWKYMFWFENTNTDPVSVELRWAALIQMLSTAQSGFSPGGRPFIVAGGNRPWILDHILTGADIPKIIEFYKSSTQPNPSLRLYLQPDDTHTDQTEIQTVAVGTYNRTINNLFSSQILPDAPIDGTGVALYTKPINLPAGHNWFAGQGIQDPMLLPPDMVLYMSLASGASDVQDTAVGLGVGTEAPSAVSYNPDGYNRLDPNPFQIVAKATNLYRRAEAPADLLNVTCTIDLPEGLELDPTVLNNDRQKTISRIDPNETQSVQWTVRATGTVTGKIPYNVVISCPTPQISKVVEHYVVVSANDVYPFKSYWEMITLPFDFSNQALNRIFAADCAEPFNNFYAYRFLASAVNPWQILTTNPGRGFGFFVKLNQDETDPRLLTDAGAQLCGAAPPSGQLTNDYTITVQPGWTQIGSPWLFPVKWRQLQFINPNNPNKVLTFNEAESANLVGSTLYQWNPDKNSGDGGYDSITDAEYQMQPLRGYFIKVKTNKPLQIIYPPVLLPGAGQTSSSAVSLPAKSKYGLQGANGWRFELKLKSGSTEREGYFFGAASDAKDKLDRYDVELPPLPDNSFYGYFENLSWSKDSGSYTTDIRDSSRFAQTYSYVVNSAAQRSITISWERLLNMPAKTTVKLIDKQTGKTIDMLKNTSYTFSGKGLRRFYIVTTK